MTYNYEKLRVDVVKQFENLNLEVDKELQQIVTHAALLCNVPVSSITLVDHDTQYIKVKTGIDIDHTERILSFCTHAIEHDELMVVNDMDADPRFHDHPFVKGGLHIKFYAGAPLITLDGYAIGTLCVMDFKPRQLNDEQKLVLTILSKHVIGVMELKLSINRLDQNLIELKSERKKNVNAELKLRSMFESFTDAYYLWGTAGQVIDFNKAAYDIILEKYGMTLTYGNVIADFTNNYTEQFTHNYHEALKGNRVYHERRADYGSKGIIWWDCAFEPMYNAANEVIGVSYVTRDITGRKLHEEKIKDQNRRLLRIAEIQSHDYRAPVASILGLMNLIADDDYIASKEYLTMLHSAVNKLDDKIREVINYVNEPKANLKV